MTRPYRMRRRAEQQAETRRKIVEATVALHGSLGPARTSIKAIAERAGVQRHTVYSHFPTPDALHAACSGLHVERHPLPDPARWQGIADGAARLRHGLGELFAYYQQHQRLLGNVLRDVAVVVPARRAVRKRIQPRLEAMRDVLADGFAVAGRERGTLDAAIALAMDFQTWNLLVHRQGLSDEQAAALLAQMVGCAAGARSGDSSAS